MPRTSKPPAYCLHKARGCAVVTIDGKNHYLGLHGSPESHEKYSRHIAEWSHRRAHGAAATVPTSQVATPTTVNDLVLRYLAFAENRYQKNDKPTGELENIRCAVKPVVESYGRSLVSDFHAADLEVIQTGMVLADLARSTINARIRRIRRMFKWGHKLKLAPRDVYLSLSAVEAIEKGHIVLRADGTEKVVRETKKVMPVDEGVVNQTLTHLNPVVAAMIELQLLTAARGQDMRNLRTCDLDMSRDVWVYSEARESAQTDHRQQNMNRASNHDERIARMTFASVYPHYLANVEKKGRTKEELHQVIQWLTGYNEATLKKHIKDKVTFEQFFANADLNPNARLITAARRTAFES